MKAIVYYKDLEAGEVWRDEIDQFFFQYKKEYLTNKNARAISFTLPLQEETFNSNDLFSFFDGIIPEGWLLSLALDKWKLNPLRNRFELLISTCRDAIGAVSIQTNTKGDPLINNPDSIEKEYDDDLKNNFKEKYKRCLYCYDELASQDYLYHPKCALKLFGSKEVPTLNIDEKQIRNLGEESLNQKLSVTGVQKKISLDFEGLGKTNRLTMVNLWGKYIFKPKGEPPHLPENEHLIMLLAKKLGLECAECGLLPLPDGNLAYISKRFDRGSKKQKFHMEDFCQILNKPTYKKYSGSIEQVGKVLYELDVPGDNLYRLFELVVFCYLTGNVDLHLKNISLLYENEKYGEITRISPCYDLLSTDLYLDGDDDSALAINGKKNKLTKNDFSQLAKNLGLATKVYETIYNKLITNLKKLEPLIKKSYLPPKDQEKLISIIKKRSELFD